MMRGHRAHVLWSAAMLHRISGLLLAIFLPVHFLVLGLAIEGEGRLDQALAWSEQAPVKLAEMGLVFLLAAHLAGGVRVLVLETFVWRDWQKALAGAAVGVSVLAALAFGMRVF